MTVRSPREHTRFISGYLTSQLGKLEEMRQSMQEELAELQEECKHPDVVAGVCGDCLCVVPVLVEG